MTTDHKSLGLPTQELYVGIDGGGTKCKAAIVDEQYNILGTGIAGPGNPLYGADRAKYSIRDAAFSALRDAIQHSPALSSVSLDQLNAGIGLAGVNVPSAYKEINSWKSPFKSVHLATDLLIACKGAHGGKDGGVIICGTGSCGYSYLNGVEKTVGGMGFPQGDQASGAWFGLKAVEKVLQSLDGIGDSTRMTHYLLEHLGVKDATAIVSVVSSQTPTVFAGLANVVFSAVEDEDFVAKSILNEAAWYIERMIRSIVGDSEHRVCFMGGLSKLIMPHLNKGLQARLSPPEYQPEVGAVINARHQPKKLS